MAAAGADGTLLMDTNSIVVPRSKKRQWAATSAQLTRPRDFAFVVNTDNGKPDEQTRKLIRRKVMLGKNKKTTKAKTDANVHLASDLDPYKQALTELTVAIPGRVGGDLSFVHFADAIEPELFNDVLSFSIIAKKTLWPLEPCVAFTKRPGEWMELLTFDAVYLHILVSSTAMLLAVLGGTPSRKAHAAALHRHKALHGLRIRLSGDDEAEKTSDLTLKVVLGLALHAFMSGDSFTAQQHMHGFSQMVHLRGGVGSFISHAKMFAEMIRADLTIALFDDRRPTLFTNQDDLECYLPVPWPLMRDFSKQYKIAEPTLSSPVFNKADHLELDEAWRAMQFFAAVINGCSRKNLKIPDTIVLRVIGSVMYRLLQPTSPLSPTDGAISASLLAFCSTVFLHWPNAKPALGKFEPKLAASLRSLATYQGHDSRLFIWALMIGIGSGLHDEAWKTLLHGQLASCMPVSWDILRMRLKHYLWIDIIHDDPGKALFQILGSGG